MKNSIKVFVYICVITLLSACSFKQNILEINQYAIDFKSNKSSVNSIYIEDVNVNKSFDKIERIITAPEGRYNFGKKVWMLKDVNIYYGDDNKKPETKEFFSDSKYGDNPEHFITLTVEPRTLTIKDLKKT